MVFFKMAHRVLIFSFLLHKFILSSNEKSQHETDKFLLYSYCTMVHITAM